MKKLLIVLILLNYQLLIATLQRAQCQTNYWQQQVNFQINVSLNDKEHSLTGFEKIDYINNSPDTLTFIWFHIWPNAYKTDKTAFSDQQLQNGNTKFYFSNREQKGYINKLDFKVNNITAETEDHPQHIDIIKLNLPSPLAPGKKIIITTPFHVRLPYNFSRGGHDGESYQVTQWYPKPAVYDKYGWHPMPYLDQGEFYSEFGSYDVSITLPENYVVAATGVLQNEEEKKWLKGRESFAWKPLKKKVKRGGSYKTIVQKFPPSSSHLKTIRFKQENVHEFAWFADKRFIVRYDTCILSAGRTIEVYSYYTPAQEKQWTNSVAFTKDALRTRSEWIGPYPYSVISVVEGPESFGGGMEYPSIMVISPTLDEKLLDYTIAHEVGHNWFYSALGSNERKYPWLDEGLNTFYDNRYSKWKYGKGEIGMGKSAVSIKNAQRLLFETKAVTKKDQPINTTSENFTLVNYGLIAYYKTGAWLEGMEQAIGKSVFDKAMQRYYAEWQTRHPQPADLKKILEEESDQNIDSFFAQLDKKGLLLPSLQEGLKPVFVPNPGSIANYINNPTQDILAFGPLLGFNSYDKLMLGGFITNYKLPPSPLQFFFSPMYATGSKTITGTGLINYSFYPDGIFQKINLGVSGSRFNMNRYKDSAGEKTFTSFNKIVPAVKLVLKEADARSNRYRFIQFRTFLINEESLNFYRDTAISQVGDTSIQTKIRKGNENRTLNQLRLVAENNRALYPYSGELKLEQGTHFIRTAFTGNYFFNYAKEEGGLEARLFAGKFFYTSPKTFTKQFETDRYHLNMTGANGYEDYTYSDYFIGRNEFEGIASQQIMIRDGGFKVRTDLLADKTGKTDDWLIALNLTTSLPSNINPLSVLPVKIPLKLFVDIGTYGDAWRKNATEDRFLFDAGLQIPLFRNIVNIYIPLVYSKVYKDYIKSTIEKKNRFLKTISFSINVSAFSLRKLNRNFAL